MTNEEAKKRLSSFTKEYVNLLYDYDRDAIETAIEALEKQVPKKPTHDGIRHTCPTCNQPLPNVAHNNCMYCGQAIDWSKE